MDTEFKFDIIEDSDNTVQEKDTSGFDKSVVQRPIEDKFRNSKYMVNTSGITKAQQNKQQAIIDENQQKIIVKLIDDADKMTRLEAVLRVVLICLGVGISILLVLLVFVLIFNL